jgi:hypothetical protein
MFATADEIALAVVMASGRFGDDPIAVITQYAESKSRWHAFAGLIEGFPEAPRGAIARGCGFTGSTKHAKFAYRNLKANIVRQKWFDRGLVDEIVAAFRPCALPSEGIVSTMSETVSQDSAPIPADPIPTEKPAGCAREIPGKSGKIRKNHEKSAEPAERQLGKAPELRRTLPDPFAPPSYRRLKHGEPDKRALQGLLADAAAETARLEAEAKREA